MDTSIFDVIGKAAIDELLTLDTGKIAERFRDDDHFIAAVAATHLYARVGKLPESIFPLLFLSSSIR